MRVLVVDDERTSLLIMRMYVELHGGEAVTFTDPEAALGEAGCSRFDLAVLDVHMPKLDGIALAEHLRQVAPDLPIMIISVDDDSDLRRAALQAGASEVMVKPVARNDFGTAFGRLLNPPQSVPVAAVAAASSSA
jgi:DNA-binding response OmpR family regulator